MSERLTTLLDAVDALTLPTTVKVIQGPGKPTVIKHDPLLTQLQAAIVAGTDRSSNASPARERMPLNADAMRLCDEIEGKLIRWQLRLSKSVRFDTLAGQLRAWYALYLATVRSEHTDLQYERILTGWHREITNMFDPPTRLEITAPCPLCNARVSVEQGTGNQVTAVVVEYLEIGAATLDEATGSCRACGVVWKGRAALRELRWLIEAAETADVA
jgi:hypothetical protein